MACMMEQDEEIDLSPLVMHNASASPFFTSPTSSPVPEKIPQVLPRPISKRRGKKRSSRACTTCRQRKVRCNIVAHGAPCSNCRHDEIECILPLSRRQRAAREKAEQNFKNALFSSEVAQREEEQVHAKPIAASLTDAQPESVLAPHGMRLSEHVLAETLPVPDIASLEKRCLPDPPSSSRTRSWIQVESPFASAPVRVPGVVEKSIKRLPVLPAVFEPFPRRLNATDLLYLNSRDAFTLPSEELQIVLLKAYIDFVHGRIPILDLEEFVGSVKYGSQGQDMRDESSFEKKETNKKQISLLLFQAVMFAGLEYVSSKTLRLFGYQSKGDAQRIFFSRARLLYDFDTCADRLTIIQALLLMTLYPSQSHGLDTKDEWHWLGLAISLSFSLGINRDISQAPNNARRKRLERRVWWSVFVRDRVLALHGGARCIRPVRIRQDDCDVDTLCLEDFDLDEENDLRGLRDARDYVEKVVLCWCSNDAMLSNFSATSWGPQTPAVRNTIQGIPTSGTISGKEIQNASDACDGPHDYFSERASTVDVEVEGQFESCTSPSMHEDCVTPGTEQHDSRGRSRPSSILDGGYGVDGEYDDYLEFLRPTIEDSMRKKLDVGEYELTKPTENRSIWAIQLDCENDRILSI